MRSAGAWIGGIIAALIWAQPAAAEFDLSRTYLNRFPNGLTFMVLEDRSFPVVSVQMLYKSGSADEIVSKSGLAHFVEHLAFRASRNFPNAGATEAIYDAGGEWHGYTWLNQTTYFATVPKDQLELLLRIEADRMTGVTIDEAAVKAEKGAVLAEMHGYENDPQSVLLDAVTATAFQADTYGNNTIGLEADVERLTVGDVRDFYEKHYIPANATLVIVGDVNTDEAHRLISRYFRGITPRGTPMRNRSPEPVQRGERRIVLNGPVDREYFTIAYPAPAASNPDVAAFLVMQQLIGAGSGFNFNQNDWGTPAEAGSLLHGLTSDIATWFIPTGGRYIFTIKGSLDQGADRNSIEQGIERQLQLLRDGPPSEERLASAQAAVLRQLAEDIETTEDAAHQLAYFGGYDISSKMPERVRSVTPANVAQVAAAYLNPQTRTVGWHVPGTATAEARMGDTVPNSSKAQLARPADTDPIPQPVMDRLRGGLPVILQPNSRTQSATVQLLLCAPVEGEVAPADFPGLGIIKRSGDAADLAMIVAQARMALEKPLAQPRVASTPDEKLEEMIAATIGLSPPTMARPVLAVVSGGIEPGAARALLEQAFGDQRNPPLPVRSHDPPREPGALSGRMERPFAQGALGYVVPAPPPRKDAALAWRMLLYILSHDYSGRLGRSAIGEKGLAYHIASAYRTDGRRGWITLTAGVDPAKADELEAEFRAQIARLAAEPPTEAEVAAARNHILGRSLTAAQSNGELADKLTREYMEYGRMLSSEDLRTLLNSITVDDIAAAAAEFGKGSILRVDVDPLKR